MSAVFLNWRSLCHSYESRYLVNGTELGVALCGPQSRFAVYEIRCRGADGFPDRRYVVRDAAKISDADVKAGKRPPIVAQTDDYTKIESWIARGCPDGAEADRRCADVSSGEASQETGTIPSDARRPRKNSSGEKRKGSAMHGIGCHS